MVFQRNIIFAAVFVRALATGMMGVLLGIYLAKLSFDVITIGVVIGSGLFGATLAAFLVTVYGDIFGRKRCLIIVSALSTVGALIAAFGASPVVILSASFIGMLNGMGRDRGASLILEQSMLASMASLKKRTPTFAWYNVLQDIGHALGSLLAGLPAILGSVYGFDSLFAFRIAIIVNAFLTALTALTYLLLPGSVEVNSVPGKIIISPKSKNIIYKISLLFGFDSLAGGFLTTALISLFFYNKFGISEDILGVLFFLARVANALSHLGAAWLASRIGLVNTMVFTHIPASLVLIAVAFVSDFWVAAILYLVRESLVEMDVPTRQSYVMAVVQPEERTYASGVTNIVRMGGWMVAPSFAGIFMSALTQGAHLIIGASMKVIYDVLLYVSFRSIKPPEEKS